MNYVSEKNAVKPRYDLSEKPVQVHFYISKDRQLLMVGFIDSNYICYLSKTRINDVRTNSTIFNEIVTSKKEHVTYLVRALKEIGMKPDELNLWVKGEVEVSSNPRYAFTTTMNTRYIDKQAGRYFSKDLTDYYNYLKREAFYRCADGLYLPVLEKYCTLLKEQPYSEVKPLIELLEKEKYCLFAEDRQVAEKYLEIVNQIKTLNNIQSTKEH